MMNTRLSVPADIPAQRELWELAFGDSGAYVDNFYENYYRPDRVLVLVEDGHIRAMTAWFDTTFVVPGDGEYRAAYLYAVATHPDCRGRGLAGRLLADADRYFRGLSIPAVTTVPAEPSLHNFFGANGFRECFKTFEGKLEPREIPAPKGDSLLRPVTPAEYGAVREKLLAGIPHIAYPVDALTYQAGCCNLSGGGLYAGETAAGPVCLCAEGAEDGLVIVKEYLGSPTAKRLSLPDLPRIAPADRWLVREPMPDDPKVSGGRKFAMLKWLDAEQEKNWAWDATAYLGLAFD